jgi:porphobilinogen synthase
MARCFVSFPYGRKSKIAPWLFLRHALSRMRATPAVRRMIREIELTPNDLIQPFFVRPGKNERRPVRSMPGVFQLSIDQVLKDARVVAKLGVPAIILFGIPEKKDAAGREAYDSDGIVQRAVRAVKDALPELLVITDLCLCEYTDHGHCGVLRPADTRWDELITT